MRTRTCWIAWFGRLQRCTSISTMAADSCGVLSATRPPAVSVRSHSSWPMSSYLHRSRTGSRSLVAGFIGSVAHAKIKSEFGHTVCYERQ